MMSVRTLFVLIAILLPPAASAHNFVIGQRMPVTGIADKGELLWQQDKFSYQRWNSAELPGIVRAVATYCQPFICEGRKRCVN